MQSTDTDATAAFGPTSASAPKAEDATPQGGWHVGARYRVIERIGSGGMADVLRAHDEMLARDVAIKVFRSIASLPDTAAGLERQRAELHALARLNHPNLITLYDGSLGEGDEPAYLVMELIDGPTLAARIAEGPLPDDELRVIGAQIADALAYVHASGMVHRDVKPANILLGCDRTGDVAAPRARLSDFGIVRLLGTERMTAVDSTLGTASYLAPEQARGLEVGPAADIYSLGLSLLEALTAVRAFEGTPLEAAIARLERDPHIPTDLPAPWPELLTSMTARDPEQRPTAAALAMALRSGDTARIPLAAAAVPAAAMLAGAAAPAASALSEPAGDADRTALVHTGARHAISADDRPPKHRPVGWLLFAALAVVIIGVSGFLMMRPAAHAGSAPTLGGPSGESSSSAAPTKHSNHSKAPAVTLRGTSGAVVAPRASHHASATHHPSAHSSTAATSHAPATSAPPTTAASTSQPTTAPATSTASSTVADPGTSTAVTSPADVATSSAGA